MKRESITSPNAPEAIGPYSPAMRVGNTVYLSGQIALDPASGQLINASFHEESRRVFRNLEAVLAAAGASFGDVVRMTVYLTDLSNFSFVNAVMSEFLPPPFPARAAIGVSGLPRGAAIEVDAIAVIAD